MEKRSLLVNGVGWHPMNPIRDTGVVKDPSPAPRTGRGTHGEVGAWAIGRVLPAFSHPV
jgi:hypothetical protein